MTRIVVNIAMTIEAPDQAGLAALYRCGLAQIAVAMSTDRRQGSLYVNGDLEYGSHRLMTGHYTIDNHTPPLPPQQDFPISTTTTNESTT